MNTPGAPSTAWRYSGTLAGNQVMIIKGIPANVYYSVSPAGLCMTLPRSGSDTVGSASFGVICQGTTGKVCFWDNAKPVGWNPANGAVVLSEQKVIASTNAADLADGTFIGGDILKNHNGGMCTDCHAGKNAFIMIPGTALDLRPFGVNMDATTWYDPIVTAGWLQNTGPGTQLNGVGTGGGGSCLSCHNNTAQGPFLPPVGTIDGNRSGYCSRVLQEARSMMKMPPGGVGDFNAHWDALLLDFCTQPIPNTPPPMVMPPTPRMALDPALSASLGNLILF